MTGVTDDHTSALMDNASEAKETSLLLNVKQVSEILNCSRTRVFQLVREGVLKKVESTIVGGSTRFRRVDIEKIANGG